VGCVKSKQRELNLKETAMNRTASTNGMPYPDCKKSSDDVTDIINYRKFVEKVWSLEAQPPAAALLVGLHNVVTKSIDPIKGFFFPTGRGKTFCYDEALRLYPVAAQAGQGSLQEQTAVLASLEEAKAKHMLIKDFSKGYTQRRGGPNGLALKASKEELAIASGRKEPALAHQGMTTRASKRTAAASAARPTKARRTA